MTKKSGQKFKYTENKKSFWSEIKNIFIIFKGPSTVKKLESTLLNTKEILNSKDLIDSCIIHDESISINNMLKEPYNMKEAIKKSSHC